MKIKYFAFLFLLITFMSVNQFMPIPISNTAIIWVIDIVFIIYIFHYWKQIKITNKSDYIIVHIFIVWAIIGLLRGGFVAENYWEWKQLITGGLTLSLPVIVYTFNNKTISSYVLFYWFKYAVFAFFIFFFWALTIQSKGTYYFYLGPVCTIGCFFPLFPKRWKYITFILLCIMLTAALSSRSQVIKAAIALLMASACIYKQYISQKILKIVHTLFYIIPIILLTLGIYGNFNIFEELSKNKGKYSEKRIINGELKEEDLSSDTRTFIYKEVISSAILHNYIACGRTPARGNDSETFGKFTAEELKTGKYERHSNEVCHPNIFTWLGLIGTILYSLIYLKASYLAVYHSKSFYLKLLGVFIAFHWAYGWIEDCNRLDIANISLWMCIAMGLSEQFRTMTNSDFKIWIYKIFLK